MGETLELPENGEWAKSPPETLTTCNTLLFLDTLCHPYVYNLYKQTQGIPLGSPSE